MYLIENLDGVCKKQIFRTKEFIVFKD